jgi:NAD+ synthase (glutamine-hydrolysing)
MKIALAQLNPTVGDLKGNTDLIRQAADRATQSGARLLVTSELVISGYPPKDLLLREGFAEACDAAVQTLSSQLPPQLGVLVGHHSRVTDAGRRVANAASLLLGGKIQQTVHKCLLPNYDVFDERRYFLPAGQIAPVEFDGLRLGVHICEDAWYGEQSTFYHLESELHRDPVAELADAGVDLFINLSASPFELDKLQRRTALVQRHVQRHRRPFLFVNQVGGNDDLVFDGGSFAIDADGRRVLQLQSFAPDFAMYERAILPATASPGILPATASRVSDLLDALVLGLRVYGHI